MLHGFVALVFGSSILVEQEAVIREVQEYLDPGQTLAASKLSHPKSDTYDALVGQSTTRVIWLAARLVE